MANGSKTVVLKPQGVTFADVINVARFNAKVEISDEAKSAIDKSRKFIDEYTQGGKAIYGVSTGFGALADKFIAVAYRARRIKPRDIWDIVWIKQRGVALSKELVEKKLAARNKHKDDFRTALELQINKLQQDDEVRTDFNMEMSRFIPSQIKARTLDNPEYWAYVQAEVSAMASELLSNGSPKTRFDMGM